MEESFKEALWGLGALRILIVFEKVNRKKSARHMG